MKRKVSVILLLSLFVFMCGFISIAPTVMAKAEDKNLDNTITSKSAYLLDKKSGTVVFSKNEKERLPIASMCKIMTLNLIFKEIKKGNIDINENITISKKAAGMGGSQIFLEENGEYPVSTLIEGIVVASANDASVAMAERVCGSEEQFVDLMNTEAQSLGMNDTVFTNCTGLPKPGQYSCAKDVALMFSSLIDNEGYFDYSTIWMDTIKHPRDRVTEISNTNKLIRFYQGCDSGKTGYTSEAGHCIATSAERNGMRLISVVIKATDSKSRFRDASSMFDYGFSNFTNKVIVSDKENLSYDVCVLNGKKEQVIVKAEKPFVLFMKKNDKRAVELDFKCKEFNVAPLKEGDIIGELTVYENNVEIGKVNVICAENIGKASYFDNILTVIKNWSLI